GFPILIVLVRWFSKQSQLTYRKVRENSAMVIVHFVETMAGIRAVESYRRAPRNQQIFEDLSERYRNANLKSSRLVAVFQPGLQQKSTRLNSSHVKISYAVFCMK